MKARHLLSIPMITFGLFASHALSDASEPWQLGLQDPATPIMESMLFFHHYLMILLVATGVFVSWMLGVVFFRFDSRVNLKVDKFSHDSLLETFWTIVPVVALAGVEPNEMILGPETAIQAAYVWASSKRGISLMRNVAFRNKKALIWLATVLLGANCSGGLSTTGIRFGGVILVGILLLVLGYFSEKAKEEPAPAPVVEPVVVVEPQVQPVGTDEGLSYADSCEGAGEVCLRFLNIAQVVCVLYITGGLPLACNLSLGFVAILVSPSAESSLVGSFFGGGEKGEEATPALENVGEATVQQLNPQWWEATYTEGGPL